MKTTQKKSVINKLYKAYGELVEAKLKIDYLNTKGKQFDFVSDPQLADITDKIVSISSQLNNMVYQGN